MDERDDLLEGVVGRALDTLFGDLPARSLTRERVEHVLGSVAQQASQIGRERALIPLMTLSEAAEVYEIQHATLRRACLEGRLPGQKSGATWLINTSDTAVKHWLAEFTPKRSVDKSE